MKSSKNTPKKRNKGGSGGGAQQFLVWNGEKFIVVAVVVAALWFAMQGVGYQALTWQPNELGTAADETRRSIEGSTRSAQDEDLRIFDYAEYAEFIKSPIPAEPYFHTTKWDPPYKPAPPNQRSVQRAQE